MRSMLRQRRWAAAPVVKDALPAWLLICSIAAPILIMKRYMLCQLNNHHPVEYNWIFVSFFQMMSTVFEKSGQIYRWAERTSVRTKRTIDNRPGGKRAQSGKRSFITFLFGLLIETFFCVWCRSKFAFLGTMPYPLQWGMIEAATHFLSNKSVFIIYALYVNIRKPLPVTHYVFQVYMSTAPMNSVNLPPWEWKLIKLHI